MPNPTGRVTPVKLGHARVSLAPGCLPSLSQIHDMRRRMTYHAPCARHTGFTAEELAHIKEDAEEKAAVAEAEAQAMIVDAAAGVKPTEKSSNGGAAGGGRSSMDMRVETGKVNILHSKLANKNLTGIESREEGNLR